MYRVIDLLIFDYVAQQDAKKRYLAFFDSVFFVLIFYSCSNRKEYPTPRTVVIALAS